VLGEEIERELRARPIFIVILSPASVTKLWVRREVTAAISLRDREPRRISPGANHDRARSGAR
jgi:hypothetical protein